MAHISCKHYLARSSNHIPLPIFTNDFFYKLAGERLLASLGELGVLDNNLSDGSTSARKQMIVFGLQLWTEKPIFGWGSSIMTRVSPWHTYAHNNYVELLASYGLFGLFFYYSAYIALIWQALKLPKKSALKCFLLALLVTPLLEQVARVDIIGLEKYLPLMVASVCLAKCRSIERARRRQLAFAEQDAASKA